MHAALRDFPLPAPSGSSVFFILVVTVVMPLVCRKFTALRSSFPLRALHRGSMGVHFLLAAFVTLRAGVRVRPAFIAASYGNLAWFGISVGGNELYMCVRLMGWARGGLRFAIYRVSWLFFDFLGDCSFINRDHRRSLSESAGTDQVWSSG
jgi:hypothetical protein